MAHPSQAISITSSSEDSLPPSTPLEKLRLAVTEYPTNYCCGGEIPITTEKITRSATSAYQPIRTPPVTIRWDVSNEPGNAHTVHLPFNTPLEGANADVNAAMFEELLKMCDPATFGLGGKDVLDEQYRKAGKLDKTQFSTGFHPHDYGIVDTIKQTLLPNALSHVMEGRVAHRGVMAELYKLNIYSGPGGRFKAHVDTPRGATQFGSLVVCLPHPFKGGEFRISHKAHSAESTILDWSKSDKPNSIQWAAFYSDCEHEVMEVTEGHRVTLTYNLYVVENMGGVVQTHPTVDATYFPLLESAERLLEDPNFMRNGGRLGFYCTHQYAHNNKATEKLMPYALKGIDVVIFSVFQRLGLQISVLPVMEDGDDDDYDEDLPEMNDDGEFENNSDNDSWDGRGGQMVGTAFHPVEFGGEEYEMSSQEKREQIQSEWGAVPIRNVMWVNQPSDQEVAFVRMAYGNQAELEWKYSYATIMVEVPKAGERVLDREMPEAHESQSRAQF